MNDLTTGSIPRHIVRLAVPMALGMIFQTLYYLVDLYFVARLGDAAVAGVSAAGNVQFIIMSFTQILGVSTMALIAHAVGRKDQPDANLVFNQSVLWAFVCGIGTLVVGYALCGRYMSALGSNADTIAAGTSYLRWYIPGLALQFALVSMGSALRGTGIVKPGMLVQMLTVVLNVVFVAVELAAGFLSGSLALVADAGHNAGDVVGLLLAWGAGWLARRPPTARYTWGYRRATIYAALANAVFDATGVRFRRLPLTPARVLQGLQEKRA
jgi:O-antigen/teichoic acid export membrane protein